MSDTLGTPAATQAQTPTQDSGFEHAQAADSAQAQPGKEGAAESLGEIAKEAARKLKLKDKKTGQELEVDEDEVTMTYLQRKEHQRAANKKFQEGLALRKQAEEFVSMLKDPSKMWEVAKKLGHDPRKLSEEYLATVLEEEMLDPRERELREVKRQLKEREEREAMLKKQAEEKLHNQLKAKYAKDYSDQFVKALESSGLPPTKPMVAEMAKYIQRAAHLGFKMTADEASKLVKEDLEVRMRRLIGESDGETLIKLLGEEVANKVRKWDTSRLKDPNQFIKTPTPAEQAGDRDRRGRFKTGKRMTPQEWRKFNRS